jgi:hypothetical protein
VSSALITSLLVHLRLLDDFLTRKTRSMRAGRELDDVLAIDYLPS